MDLDLILESSNIDDLLQKQTTDFSEPAAKSKKEQREKQLRNERRKRVSGRLCKC